MTGSGYKTPFMTIEIKLRKGEPMDRAIRRLKKRLDREGVIRDVRAKRYFEKPSDKKRRLEKLLHLHRCSVLVTKKCKPTIPLSGNLLVSYLLRF